MRTDFGTLIENINIAKDVYQMCIRTEIAKEVQCGQFVQVDIPGFFLRRPISVSEVTEDGELVLVYKVVGDGTKIMAELVPGMKIDLFGPLGTGFPVEERDVLLLGGGVGVPPLIETAKRYIAKGHKVTAVLGFNVKQDVILEERFREVGVDVYCATMDGSYGVKGTVLDAVKENSITDTFVLSCGPLPMLKAVSNTYTDGYVSLEARMACGMGACMGCVVKDEEGNSLRVCKDGPVFPIGKVVL